MKRPGRGALPGEVTATRRTVLRGIGLGGVGTAVAALFGRGAYASAAQVSSTTTSTPVAPTTTTTPASTTTTTPASTTTTAAASTTTTAPAAATTSTTVPPGSTYVLTTDVRLPTGNVKYYGAKGDGVTDDTAAIQAAINDAYLVYFPAGTYKCASTLRVRNGTRLLGEARGQGAASGNVVQIDSRVIGLSGDPAAVRVDAGSVSAGVGITIENIWIKGNAASTRDYGYAKFPSYGVYAGTQTNGLTLRESAVTGFTVNVLLIDATYCKIDHCLIARAVNTNLLLYGMCNQIKLTETQFVVPNEVGTANPASVLSNIYLQARNSSQFPRWVSIHNCLIDEVANSGQTTTNATVRIDQSEDVHLSETVVYTPISPGGQSTRGYGVKVGPGCRRVSLRDVRVEPYTVDSRHVPLQTIILDQASAECSLTDVTTVANGGGDIDDEAADTSWRNVNGFSRHRVFTGSRPSAAAAGIGAVLYDTSIGRPIFSDGTTWRDAGGGIV